MSERQVQFIKLEDLSFNMFETIRRIDEVCLKAATKTKQLNETINLALSHIINLIRIKYFNHFLFFLDYYNKYVAFVLSQEKMTERKMMNFTEKEIDNMLKKYSNENYDGLEEFDCDLRNNNLTFEELKSFIFEIHKKYSPKTLKEIFNRPFITNTDIPNISEEIIELLSDLVSLNSSLIIIFRLQKSFNTMEELENLLDRGDLVLDDVIKILNSVNLYYPKRFISSEDVELFHFIEGNKEEIVHFYHDKIKEKLYDKGLYQLRNNTKEILVAYYEIRSDLFINEIITESEMDDVVNLDEYDDSMPSDEFIVGRRLSANGYEEMSSEKVRLLDFSDKITQAPEKILKLKFAVDINNSYYIVNDNFDIVETIIAPIGESSTLGCFYAVYAKSMHSHTFKYYRTIEINGVNRIFYCMELLILNAAKVYRNARKDELDNEGNQLKVVDIGLQFRWQDKDLIERTIVHPHFSKFEDVDDPRYRREKAKLFIEWCFKESKDEF